MYEGKNIHFSPVDNKPLCSYSVKLCKQRRLNGYSLCVRHVLEDPDAPFKQCCYVSKYSKQKCINPVPKAEERLYCNNHLQVLGLIPRKEKKSPKERVTKERSHIISGDGKDTPSGILDSKMKMDSGGLRSKFHIRHKKVNLASSALDPEDDPYAFPEDPTPAILGPPKMIKQETSPRSGVSPSSQVNSILSSSLSTLHNHHVEPNNLEVPATSIGSSVNKLGTALSSEKTPCLMNTSVPHAPLPQPKSVTVSNPSSTTSLSSSSGSGFSIARLYPELAEKLERTKLKAAEPPRKETKSQKSKNSRTMHRLQTRIAQNKIKDKLKRSQSHSNQATPEHQPSTPSSVGSASNEPLMSQCSAPAVDNTLPFVGGGGGGEKHVSPPVEMPLKVHIPNPQPGLCVPRNISPLHHESITYQHLFPTSCRNQVAMWQQRHLGSQPHPPFVTHLPPPPPIPQAAQISEHVHKELVSAPTPPSKCHSWQMSPKCVLQRQSGHKRSTSPSLPENFTSIIPPAHQQDEPCLPILYARPKRSRNVMSEKEAKQKLKRHSAVKAYSYFAKQQIRNNDLLSIGFDSSSDDEGENFSERLPRQHEWYAASSSEDGDSDDEDDLPMYARITKLSLLRSRLRRQFTQLRRSMCTNVAAYNYQMNALKALVDSARHSPDAACKAVKEMQQRSLGSWNVEKVKQCLHTSDQEPLCSKPTLPLTNHCMRHIMYNVDQQLFDYCTAKFSDNTQCCVPVFDIKHELPLCLEHGAKADNYNKNQEPKVKKPRKKTKPSALTRPPKRGKKKKNQKRNVRPQKPMPPSEPVGDLEMPPSDVDVVSTDHPTPVPQSAAAAAPPAVAVAVPPPPPTPPRTLSITRQDSCPAAIQQSAPLMMKQLSAPPLTPPSRLHPAPQEIPLAPQHHLPHPSTLQAPGFAVSNAPSSAPPPPPVPPPPPAVLESELPDEMVVPLSPGTIEKNLGLNLEEDQSTKFLDVDDHEFHDVFNKLPDEAFDLFSGKNGEFVPTREEAEALERALAEATRHVDDAKKSLEKYSHDSMMIDEDSNGSDELTKQIADTILNTQNLSPAESIADDMETDNINALANSISANEFKSISQALQTPPLCTMEGSGVGSSTMSSGLQNGETHPTQGSSHHFMSRPPQTSGAYTVLQSQLAQGPMAPGQLHLQLNTSYSTASLQRQLSGDQSLQQTPIASFNGNSTIFGNVPPHIVTTLPTAVGQTQTTVMNFTPVINQQQVSSQPTTLPPQSLAPVTFQNGFPINQASAQFPVLGAGVKVAYPLQTLFPGTMVASPMPLHQLNQMAAGGPLQLNPPPVAPQALPQLSESALQKKV